MENLENWILKDNAVERRLSENEIEKTYMNDSNTQKERKPVRKIACENAGRNCFECDLNLPFSAFLVRTFMWLDLFMAQFVFLEIAATV